MGRYSKLDSGTRLQAILAGSGRDRPPARTTRSVRRLPRLTEAEVAELVALRQAGEQIDILAERFGVGRNTVLAHLKRRGVPGQRWRGRTLNAEQLDEVGRPSRWRAQVRCGAMSVDPETKTRLCEAARKVLANAYAERSGFRVGAAVQGRSVHVGVNVENASYGASLCAERAALAAAVADGDLDLSALAIAFSDGGDPSSRLPCGICLQWLAELAPSIEVIICGQDGSYQLEDLLPHPFRLPRPSR